MRKWLWIALITVGCDQLVKALAEAHRTVFTVIPGVIGVTYVRNTGMAFSLFSGRPWLLGILSGLCILAGWLTLRRYTLGPLSRTAAMLMLGGAAGNMIDRLLRGYVVDMVEFLFVRFAIFNVADAALTIGTVIMVFALLLCPDDWREKHGST